MTTKMMEVVVCDFAHKHDKPAVTKVCIDVCSQHGAMFDAAPVGEFACNHCDRMFTTSQGLGRHVGAMHKAAKPTAA